MSRPEAALPGPGTPKGWGPLNLGITRSALPSHLLLRDLGPGSSSGRGAARVIPQRHLLATPCSGPGAAEGQCGPCCGPPSPRAGGEAARPAGVAARGRDSLASPPGRAIPHTRAPTFQPPEPTSLPCSPRTLSHRGPRALPVPLTPGLAWRGPAGVKSPHPTPTIGQVSPPPHPEEKPETGVSPRSRVPC